MKRFNTKLSGALISRRLINTSKTNHTITPDILSTSFHDVSSTQTTKPFPPKITTYLDTLPNKLLFSYASIGLCTLNKFTLNTVIKLFPLIPTRVLDFFIGKIYCGGSTPQEVVKTGQSLVQRGINNMMLSLTIEDSEGIKNIDINHIVSETIGSIGNILRPHLLNVIESGKEDINSIAPGYVALKPSALVSNPAEVLLNYQNPEWASKWNELNDNCSRIVDEIVILNEELFLKYPERKSPFFVAVIDAEKYDLQQGVYLLQRNLFKKFNKPNKPTPVVGTFQLYLKDAFDQIKLEEKLAKESNYRVGLKLVRGAYIHSEPNRNVIHDTQSDTDNAYNSGVQYVLKDLSENLSAATLGHLVVATHNEKSSLLASTQIASSSNVDFKSNVVLGQLLGMCDNVTHKLINELGIKNIIKYVPWGPPVETKDYLLRRLQENGDAVRNDNGWPLVKNVLKIYKERLFG